MKNPRKKMDRSTYYNNIIQYYRETEHAYKDSWALDKSLAIHYGYWDETVSDFPASLLRMNEVMIEAANIKKGDSVLDAGCGVGGSSIFIAERTGAKVTGISLSERQIEQAKRNAVSKGVEASTDFQVMDYCHTRFPDQCFDVIWGCESICYAPIKEEFIREAFRLLKPGGRLVVADGFVGRKENNDHPYIRKWLDGWQVNYLETTEGFSSSMEESGFTGITCRNISRETAHSARRLYRFYFLASVYLLWKKINFSKPATDMQKKNIAACKYQYLGRRKGLWNYSLILGIKPNG